MHKKIQLPLIAIVLALWSASSVAATPTCPTAKGCGKINGFMDECKVSKRAKACEQFASEFKRELAVYDCTATGSVQADVQVPAITLCSNHEEMIEFLAKLHHRKAREVFGSASFRKILDGALAEAYLKDSVRTGKSLQKK